MRDSEEISKIHHNILSIAITWNCSTHHIFHSNILCTEYLRHVSSAVKNKLHDWYVHKSFREKVLNTIIFIFIMIFCFSSVWLCLFRSVFYLPLTPQPLESVRISQFYSKLCLIFDQLKMKPKHTIEMACIEQNVYVKQRQWENMSFGWLFI